MTVQAKTPDIAAVADTGAPTPPPGPRQEASPATLTCAWVRADDGALVMRWTAQTPADAHEETTKAAA